ncbi:hypothetical protein BJV77DRAFT_1146974, partial [Russula vinacea]
VAHLVLTSDFWLVIHHVSRYGAILILRLFWTLLLLSKSRLLVYCPAQRPSIFLFNCDLHKFTVHLLPFISLFITAYHAFYHRGFSSGRQPGSTFSITCCLRCCSSVSSCPGWGKARLYVRCLQDSRQLFRHQHYDPIGVQTYQLKTHRRTT